MTISKKEKLPPGSFFIFCFYCLQLKTTIDILILLKRVELIKEMLCLRTITFIAITVV